MKKCYIVLEDGQTFEGLRFGADGETVGELVFTTGMGAYIETLTDPSYFGQIVMQTFPLIGNYGGINSDSESNEIKAKAYVVREWCEKPSNFRMENNIDEELKKRGVIGVCGVDTRRITRIIREKGVMNAAITDNPDSIDFSLLKSYTIKDALANVSIKDTFETYRSNNEKYNVTLIDYGAKMNIIRCLQNRNCSVTVVPYNTSAEQILAQNPDGIMLSNGPGNPEENLYSIEQLKILAGKKPMFGICLGHQLLALAMGADTVKMKYGHRGSNQPVKDLSSGRIYITSQNHGYVVVNSTVEKAGGKITFVNGNDGTCEGVSYPSHKAFSVQFHPEACGGPKDSEAVLFDKFVSMIQAEK